MEARGEVLPSARRFTQMSKHRDAQDVNRNGHFLLICFLGPDGDALIRAQAHRESFQTQMDSFCVTTAGLQPRSGSGLSEKWAGLTTVTFTLLVQRKNFGLHRFVFVCCGHSL